MSIVFINNAAKRSKIVLFSANILRQHFQESKNQQAEIVAKINAFCVVPIHLETGCWWQWWDLDQLFSRCSDSSWLLLFGSWCCDNQTVNYAVMMIFIENMTKQFRCWCWWWRGIANIIVSALCCLMQQTRRQQVNIIVDHVLLDCSAKYRESHDEIDSCDCIQSGNIDLVHTVKSVMKNQSESSGIC